MVPQVQACADSDQLHMHDTNPNLLSFHVFARLTRPASEGVAICAGTALQSGAVAVSERGQRKLAHPTHAACVRMERTLCGCRVR